MVSRKESYESDTKISKIFYPTKKQRVIFICQNTPPPDFILLIFSILYVKMQTLSICVVFRLNRQYRSPRTTSDPTFPLHTYI